MEQKLNVNAIPSLTWNWLKMNKDSVTIDAKFAKYEPEIANVPSGISIDNTTNHLIDFPSFGTGIANHPNKKMIDSRVETESEQKEFVFNAFAQHPINKYFEVVNNDEQFIKIEGKVSEPLILNFTAKDNTVNAQTIYATSNSEATIIFVYNSADEKAQTTEFIRTKVYAEESSKIHIVKVQLLNNASLQMDDTAIVADDNAKVQFTQIEIGGQHVDSGLHVNLNGYQASFKSNVAYICQNKQYLDMNHMVYHYGKKTECNMLVNGTLKDEASKTYRGTIDFKKGCCGSKGNEMEETLILSPVAVNKSLPVILCDEEDVEGEHGSTIGRISQDILFYMQTRGISKKDAEELLSIAKIQAAAALIPSEEINEQIQKRLSVL